MLKFCKTPRKSKEDHEREKAIEEIQLVINDCNQEFLIAQNLYDAGYRKTGEAVSEVELINIFATVTSYSTIARMLLKRFTITKKLEN